MRYLVKLRGSRFNKVHMVTGHRLPNGQTEMVSACGLHWRPRSKVWREAEVSVVRPVGKHRHRPLQHIAIWPDMKEVGVTCEHCIRMGYPPFHRKASPTSPDSTSPPQTPEEEQRWISGPT